MKNDFLRWSIFSIIFTVIVGTLLHFTYNWSGQAPLVGIFAPINESVWEHLKLLFWPMLLIIFIEYFFAGESNESYIFAQAIGLTVGLLFILVFFYTYTGILGKDYLWIDILSFILSVIITNVVSYKLICQDNHTSKLERTIGYAILCLWVAAFVTFTIAPPNLPLFISQVS